METYLSFFKTYIFGKWYNYISLAVLTLLFVNNVVFFICYFATLKKNKKKQLVKNAEIKKDYGSSIKRAIEHVKLTEDATEIFSGYVDVAYIKTLINKLKSDSLSNQEKAEIEELEVYLLNFVNRQPTSSERQELSNKLGSLIKKLAKYA